MQFLCKIFIDCFCVIRARKITKNKVLYIHSNRNANLRDVWGRQYYPDILHRHEGFDFLQLRDCLQYRTTTRYKWMQNTHTRITIVLQNSTAFWKSENNYILVNIWRYLNCTCINSGADIAKQDFSLSL